MSDEAQLRIILGLKEPGKAAQIVIWDTEEICVGRSPENDLVVDSSEVSRRHALFSRSYAGFEVQDLGTPNGTAVNQRVLDGPHALQNKDVVRIGELEITFIQTRKNPAAPGLKVLYASQLKGGFASAGEEPDATCLSFAPAGGAELDVDPLESIEPNPESVPSAQTENSRGAPLTLQEGASDLEFVDFVPGESAVDPHLSSAEKHLELQLEIEGLTPDLRRSLQALLGKVIELPALRIRIK